MTTVLSLKRGDANGARIRLAPQQEWEANQPARLAKVRGKHGPENSALSYVHCRPLRAGHSMLLEH